MNPEGSKALGKEEILGFPIDVTDFSEAPSLLFDPHSRSRRTTWLACVNPHSCVVAKDDEEFRAALLAADFLVPDGIGIVYASRVLGGRIRKRVTGSDVFLRLSEDLNEIGGARVFFLGSTQETLARISVRFVKDYPNLTLAGTYSPPFKSEFSSTDAEGMIRAINAGRPDVLWVGLTAPKQEKWVHRNLGSLNVRFVGAIGAVFDFYGGAVKRSNFAFRRAGLEWLPRLVRDPRRLWRRTLISAPRFLWMLIDYRIAGERRGEDSR